ncbi:MAG TPA: DinB family protein [Anaerolineae bacterium]|nr:DinB family protein [Anaerolineae bacterium]
MVCRIDWLERDFSFEHLTIGLYPILVERLRGAPARLEDRVGALPREALTQRDGADWSMQEHTGHLLDLEELGMGRLDDFEAGKAVLRPADMGNRKTNEANHNARSIVELLDAFRLARAEFVERLESYDEAFVARTAIHPRLEKAIRAIDLAYFIAEHDDYHLTIIGELIRKFVE